MLREAACALARLRPPPRQRSPRRRVGLLEEAYARYSYIRLFRDARHAEQEERGYRVRCVLFVGQWTKNLLFDRLLEKFKLFSAFYVLTELRGREDLVTGIIENLDYTMCVKFRPRLACC